MRGGVEQIRRRKQGRGDTHDKVALKPSIIYRLVGHSLSEGGGGWVRGRAYVSSKQFGATGASLGENKQMKH